MNGASDAESDRLQVDLQADPNRAFTAIRIFEGGDYVFDTKTQPKLFHKSVRMALPRLAEETERKFRLGVAVRSEENAISNGGFSPDEFYEEEEVPHQTWMLATTHPSAVLRTPDESRGAAYDALVADLTVVAGALA